MHNVNSVPSLAFMQSSRVASLDEVCVVTEVSTLRLADVFSFHLVCNFFSFLLACNIVSVELKMYA